MRTVALFLLVVCAFSVSLRRQRKGHLRPMPRTSLAEIQSMLSSEAGESNANLNAIQGILKGMLDRLVNEQATQAGVFADQAKDCKSEIAFRGKEVSEARIAKIKSATHMKICAGAQTSATNAQEYFETMLKTKTAQLANEKELR